MNEHWKNMLNQTAGIKRIFIEDLFSCQDLGPGNTTNNLYMFTLNTFEKVDVKLE